MQQISRKGTNKFMSNTVIANNGAEIYENRFQELTDEYISTLMHPEDIEKSNTFTGLIKYINRKYLRDYKSTICADINILNNIWELYVELVYKYNQKPTIEEFAILIGVSRTTLYDWMNENVRQDIYKDSEGNVIEDFFTWNNEHRGEPYTKEPSSLRSNTIKKWQDECRLGRYKSAATGNVGGIFLCKAVDGMVETAPIPVENKAQVQSIEAIQAKYKTPELCENGTQLAPPKADF